MTVLMQVEQFVSQSIGKWQSMRSAHSLAFKQFEEILSLITIKPIDVNSNIVNDLLKSVQHPCTDFVSPFQIIWEAQSNWEPDQETNMTSGSTILIPFPTSKSKGLMIRSSGYAEPEQAISNYEFLSDGTFFMRTKYQQTVVEERIWHISKNVRCRSSVLLTSKNLAVLQTSYASEIRVLTHS